MKNKVSDQDVLNLLSSLKNAESNYPSDMIQPRRDTYIKQAAAMAALARSGGNGSTASVSNQATISSTASGGVAVGKLLETALVVALVIEAGVAAYIYRDKIADFINSTLSPNAETIARPPDDSSSDILASEDSPTETPDLTVTFTETPEPSVTILPAADNNNTVNNGDNDSGSGGDAQVVSTPDPNDDPGLHLGQTKQPTKDPNQDEKTNSDSNNKDKNNKKE